MSDLRTEVLVAELAEARRFTRADIERASHSGYDQGARRMREIYRRRRGADAVTMLALGFAAGVLAGLWLAFDVVFATSEAPRSGSAVEAMAEAAGVEPAQAGRVGVSSPAAEPIPSPAPELGTAIEAGIAAWADPSYGSRYLALPDGPGVRVTICSQADSSRCVDRVSTDAGPDLEMQRAGRVADVSYVDFAWLCGCDPRVEVTMPVTIEYSGTSVTLPPTEAER